MKYHRNVIVISGANGFLGSHLVEALLANTDYYIIALVREKAKVQLPLYDNIFSERIEVVENDEFLRRSDTGFIDCFIHTAFARRYQPPNEIASSILFSKNIFEKIKRLGVKCIINISSVSVYSGSREFWTEDSIVSPDSIYGMAKYAVELMMNQIFDKEVMATSLRFVSIIENQKLPRKMIEDALKKNDISVWGRNQRFCYLDIEDAIHAILMLLQRDNWRKIYNVGPNKDNVALIDMAKIIKRIVENKERIYDKIRITEMDTDTLNWAGVDSTSFMKDTGWTTRNNIDQMIEKVYNKYYCNVESV